MFLDDAPAVVLVADVRGYGEGAELLGSGFDLVPCPRGEREVESFLVQHPCDREPDTRRAARDESRPFDEPSLQVGRWRGGRAEKRRGGTIRLLLSPEGRRWREGAGAALFFGGIDRVQAS